MKTNDISSTSEEELNLRPRGLFEFQGQERIKDHLKILLTSAKKRKKPAPHMLFTGPPGLGKTTLANIVAWEMNGDIYTTSGPALEKPGDLAGTLINLKEGDIFFIDEIHRLHPSVEEFLYPAMEDFKIDILVENNGTTKTLRMDIAPFTLVAATTKPGNISNPLRSRFLFIHKLQPYSKEELTQVLLRSANKMQVCLCEQAAEQIALRARGSPRIANNLLLWIRDFCLSVKDTYTINLENSLSALQRIGVDEHGLCPTDRKILEKLVIEYKGGPAGLSTLSTTCGEDPATLEDLYEPYLIEQGFIQRTPNGRVATEKAKRFIENHIALKNNP